MSYEVMNWKSKLFDELVSRTVFLIILFLVVFVVVDMTPEKERAYVVLAGLSLGAGAAKTIQNTVKAKAALDAIGRVDNGDTTEKAS